MRNACLKGSLTLCLFIAPLLCLSAGVSAASAAAVSSAAKLETAAPLVVEIKKHKGKWGGKSWGGNKYKGKNWGRRGYKNKYYVKRWNRRPHYGSVAAGVTLGTILGVAAAGMAPAPRGNLCWYWTDASMRAGYWDYCY